MSDAWFVCQEDNIKKGLTYSSQFQTLVGAANETEAQDHVYIDMLLRDDETKEIISSVELASKRPFGLIWSENPNYRRIATGPSLAAGADVRLMFQANHTHLAALDATLTNESKIMRYWKNTVGKILQELFGQNYGYFMRTTVIDFRSFGKAHISGDVPHVSAVCEFEIGVDE